MNKRFAGIFTPIATPFRPDDTLDEAGLRANIARTPDDFAVLSGSATTFVHALSAGCDGAILALAAVMPEACVEMRALVAAGRMDEARALQRRLMPLARSVGSGYGVPGLKAALELMGCAAGRPRPPLRPVSPQVVEIIRGQLVAWGGGSEGPALRDTHGAGRS